MSQPTPCTECGHLIVDGDWCFCPHDRKSGSFAAQDDTLTGGARWMHNLGHEPVWVETKTQLRQEMATRGLVPAERNVYRKDDKTPYATRTRLRPGARDDAMPRLGR